MSKMKKLSVFTNIVKVSFIDCLVKSNKRLIKGSSLLSQLKDIRDFINVHTSEFIVIQFRQEGRQLTQKTYELLIEWIQTVFEGKMITNEDVASWFNLRKVTIDQIQASNKNVLVLFDENMFTFFEGVCI